MSVRILFCKTTVTESFYLVKLQIFDSIAVTSLVGLQNFPEYASVQHFISNTFTECIDDFRVAGGKS